MSANKICQFCGATVDVNASFCNLCKSALSQDRAPGSRPVPPPPAQPPRTAAPPPPVRPISPGAPPPSPPPSRPSAPPAPAPASPTFTTPTPPPQAPAAPYVPVQPAASTPLPHSAPPVAPAYNQTPQQGRKVSGGLMVIILAFLLLLVGGGVYYLFLKPPKPPFALSNLPTDTAAGLQVTQQAQNQTQQPVETQPVQQAPTQTVEQPAQTQAAENLIYFVITEPGSNLFIRKSPGRTNKTSDDVIKRVPRGTRLEVLNTHGDSVRIDGFIWWEAKDPSTNISGWVAAEYLSTNASDVQR